MEISEEIKGAALIVSVAGRLDSNTAPQLESTLPERIESNAATIVDLSQVSYVSSAGLRILLKGAKVAKASGNRLILSGLAASVREVFDISGFSSIFAIEPDVDAALASIG
ncbi:STAS domain-containing protein [Novosphingobium mangrovi (ex Huang et al. 2023)]|uniref:Anti-sigma factor antagonist n=1 Tax=Novosphingobium mangrovi (ex Huang et al. 2023) TaxID=2976432 RepID=A0ABT2IAK2_9SPHN|nr:STAS domain-containing protein [Novosphingobium mangrovi (ex Huang et al. 2023)]MCT2401532.1 STAS domain-containing protein [Novosphingobium mangrovi (ex Huang et al. 2023)]